MPTYIALLRGINVGGKTLKMEPLRGMLGKLGFKNVQTYLQSGNAVFEAPKTTNEALAKKISDRITKDFKLLVGVVVRTPAEWSKIVAANPFMKEKGIDEARLYVTLLSGPPDQAGFAKIDALKAGKDRYLCPKKTEVYLHCPGGYGETKLSNAVIERSLKVVATTRNWNTMNELLRMTDGS